MRIVIHRRFHSRGVAVAQAIASGCKVHGLDVVMVGESQLDLMADAAVVWGASDLMPRYRAAGVPVLVAEAGYVGDRDVWNALGWNGLNGRGDFLSGDVPPDRWLRYFGDVMAPWRTPEGRRDVLLVGQVEGDRSLEGESAQGWAQQMSRTLTGLGCRVLYRPHPRRPAPIERCETQQGSLGDGLGWASHVVTYSSTVGVEAVLAGLPTYTASAVSMAYPVAAHTLDELWPGTEPLRGPWAAGLGYAQWTLAEIASGTAWSHIGALLSEAAA